MKRQLYLTEQEIGELRVCLVNLRGALLCGAKVEEIVPFEGGRIVRFFDLAGKLYYKVLVDGELR